MHLLPRPAATWTDADGVVRPFAGTGIRVRATAGCWIAFDLEEGRGIGPVLWIQQRVSGRSRRTGRGTAALALLPLSGRGVTLAVGIGQPNAWPHRVVAVDAACPRRVATLPLRELALDFAAAGTLRCTLQPWPEILLAIDVAEWPREPPRPGVPFPHLDVVARFTSGGVILTFGLAEATVVE